MYCTSSIHTFTYMQNNITYIHIVSAFFLFKNPLFYALFSTFERKSGTLIATYTIHITNMHIHTYIHTFFHIFVPKSKSFSSAAVSSNLSLNCERKCSHSFCKDAADFVASFKIVYECMYVLCMYVLRWDA